jgi:hypothetical protein
MPGFNLFSMPASPVGTNVVLVSPSTLCVTNITERTDINPAGIHAFFKVVIISPILELERSLVLHKKYLIRQNSKGFFPAINKAHN